MAIFERIAIGIAVVLVAMACMVFGDWLARGKRQPDYYYCENSRTPERNETAPTKEGAAPNEKEARKTANERNHELCNQWRQAQAAEDAAHVAWLQLWFGIAGLVGLGLTVYFTARSARAAGDAAAHTAKAVDVEIRNQQCIPFAGRLVTSTDYFDGENELIVITLRPQNIGRGPGILVGWSVNCEAVDAMPPEPTYPDSVKIRGYVWPAGEDYKIPHYLNFDKSEAVRRGAAVHLWGYFLCEDVFGTERKTGFGYQGHPFTDEAGNFKDFFWSRTGGKAYNYDREEPSKE